MLSKLSVEPFKKLKTKKKLYKTKNARAKSLLKTVFKKIPVKTCKGHIFWVLGYRLYKIIEDPKANIL